MVHKYIEIKNSLIKEIQSNQFKPGDVFYSESEAIKKFNVSSITIRRAFSELALEGYIYSIKGKGRFISQGKLKQAVTFTDVEKYPENEVDVAVLSISVVNSERIRKILQVSKEKKIYKFERLRTSNSEPFFLQYSFFSSDYIRESDIKYPELFTSIYSKMKEDWNLNLSSSPSVEYYKIVFPTPKHVADLLQINEDTPTSFAERTTYLNDGKVIEYIESYKRWDYYCSKIETI